MWKNYTTESLSNYFSLETDIKGTLSKNLKKNRLKTFREKIVEEIEIRPESKFIPKSTNFELETLSRSVANFSAAKARGELKLKDFSTRKVEEHCVKRTKSNSLCTRSYSQSTISKNSKENNPSRTAPNYLCRV